MRGKRSWREIGRPVELERKNARGKRVREGRCERIGEGRCERVGEGRGKWKEQGREEYREVVLVEGGMRLRRQRW